MIIQILMVPCIITNNSFLSIIWTNVACPILFPNIVPENGVFTLLQTCFCLLESPSLFSPYLNLNIPQGPPQASFLSQILPSASAHISH